MNNDSAEKYSCLDLAAFTQSSFSLHSASILLNTSLFSSPRAYSKCLHDFISLVKTLTLSYSCLYSFLRHYLLSCISTPGILFNNRSTKGEAEGDCLYHVVS